MIFIKFGLLEGIFKLLILNDFLGQKYNEWRRSLPIPLSQQVTEKHFFEQVFIKHMLRALGEIEK